jgi:hypothetical protein
MAPPAFDDDLSFSEGVEDLAIEQLIAKAGVEALDVAVLPRTAPLDIGSLGADSGDPSLDGLGDELRSVVGPDVTGNAAQDEQVGQNVDDIDCFELASDTDRQDSWVNSSMTLSIRYRRPSWVRNPTQDTMQACGHGRTGLAPIRLSPQVHHRRSLNRCDESTIPSPMTFMVDRGLPGV